MDSSAYIRVLIDSVRSAIQIVFFGERECDISGRSYLAKRVLSWLVDNNNDCEKSHRNARTTIEICGSHYYDEYIRLVLS